MEKTIIEYFKKFWMVLPLALLAWGWTHTSNQLTEVRTTLKTTQTTLTNERKAWKEKVKQSTIVKTKYEKIYVKQSSDGVAKYNKSVAAIKPVEKASAKMVKDYAKTPSGQSACLDASGMQLFWQQRNRLLTASTAQDTSTP